MLYNATMMPLPSFGNTADNKCALLKTERIFTVLHHTSARGKACPGGQAFAECQKTVIASQSADWCGNPFSIKAPDLSKIGQKSQCLGIRIPTVATLPRNDIGFFDRLEKPAPEGRLLNVSERLHAGVCSEACVDGQDNTGNSGSKLVVGQEQHAAQQFSGIDKAAHGGTVQNLGGTGSGSAILVEQQSAVLVGNQEAGSDGIAADAGAGKVSSQPLGEVGDGSLGAGVGGDLGQEIGRASCRERV